MRSSLHLLKRRRNPILIGKNGQLFLRHDDMLHIKNRGTNVRNFTDGRNPDLPPVQSAEVSSLKESESKVELPNKLEHLEDKSDQLSTIGELPSTSTLQQLEHKKDDLIRDENLPTSEHLVHRVVEMPANSPRLEPNFGRVSGVQETAEDSSNYSNYHRYLGHHDPLFSRSAHPSMDPSKVVESIGSAVNATKQQAVNYSHEINKAYSEVEHNMMKRINESNQRRFRLVLLSSLLFTIWVVAAFGEQIRKMLSDQTAGLAKETLENESLKVQTQELAMAVVQTVLNDKEVTAHAASFLREASVVPETQQALLALTLHVLQHPDSLRELSILVKKLIEVLVNDKDTVAQVAGLLTDALEDPKLKAALIKLVCVMVSDPEVVRMSSELTVKILEQQNVIEATNKLLMASTETVLSDSEIIEQSKVFVTDVMGDDALQKEGGDAIWNSVTHALKPGVVRILGFTLVVVSIAVGKVLLSPF